MERPPVCGRDFCAATPDASSVHAECPFRPWLRTAILPPSERSLAPRSPQSRRNLHPTVCDPNPLLITGFPAGRSPANSARSIDCPRIPESPSLYSCRLAGNGPFLPPPLPTLPGIRKEVSHDKYSHHRKTYREQRALPILRKHAREPSIVHPRRSRQSSPHSMPRRDAQHCPRAHPSWGPSGPHPGFHGRTINNIQRKYRERTHFFAPGRKCEYVQEGGYDRGAEAIPAAIRGGL